GQLTLGTPAGPIIFSSSPPFPPPDPSILLVGRTWYLTAIDDTPVVQDSTPTVLFAADGSLSGNTGCNLFSARFAVDRLALIVTPIVKTGEPCSESLITQESTLISLLGSASEYEATNTYLKVFSPDGVLNFSSQPTVPSADISTEE
ncbi:META domain-containing protein, partial [Chloroflexota bacterium]